MRKTIFQIKIDYFTKVFVANIFFFLLSVNLFAQFYNGSQLTFGKNRVQYGERFWTFYHFDKFDVYFYLGGKSLAIYTAKLTTEKVKEIEKQFDYTLEKNIQFIVFNKLSDLKQSNIGLINDEQYNVGGITHIVGSKVFLYFDGNHKNFDYQIRSGIADIIVNQMMYGESIGSMVKNSTLLSLPDWYIQGLISYVAEDWNTDIDNYVKDGILSGRYEKFNQLQGKDAVYAGHSIWRYIAEKYGKSVIPNIIYMSKISRNIESGFLFILGTSFKNLITDWLDYYDKTYYLQNKQKTLPCTENILKRINKNRVYKQLKISPDGKSVSFVTNELGQYKVWIYNLETKKLKRIMKSGYKLDQKTDYSYPLLAWHPSGKILSVIFESKGKILLYYYIIDEHKFDKLRLFHFEKILDFSYSQNGKLFVFSAIQNGQSDIFVYNIASHTYAQITNDIFDDINPGFINNSKNIVFSSNRTNDTIKYELKSDYLSNININIPKNKNIFLYNYSKKSKILKRITNTPLADETNPVEYNNQYISYLSDENGINNRYISRIDSMISYIDTAMHYRYFTTSYPITNYSRSIIEQNVSIKAKKYAEVIFSDGFYKMYVNDITLSQNIAPVKIENTDYMNKLVNIDIKAKTDSIKKKTNQDNIHNKPKPKHKGFSNVFKKDINKSDTNAVDINNYVFYTFKKQQVVSDSNKVKTIVNAKENTESDRFILPKQQNADVEYSINQLVNQLDFTSLNTTYQPFTGGENPIYINTGFNIFLKVGITDLFEDYRITGGIRISSSLEDNEYILSYDNLKKRLDKQIVFHRKSFKDATNYSLINHHTNELYYILKWPLNQVISIKGTASLRNDKAVYLSTDIDNLIKSDIYNTWTGLKAEFIFDNTRKKGLNLYYGTRYKVFAEYFKLIDKNTDQSLTVFGFDYRHYQKIHKTFIWANRFAVSTSVGPNKLIYYMGGVDNWLNPKFNNEINVDKGQHYIYQTLATNMRGFRQNIRNGNSFAVINSELRLPVFKYFSNKPIKSDFWENFQIIGFGDIGTAWTGIDPYSDKNSLFTHTITKKPITVIIKDQREPVVIGYGFGLRSRILGYFVRADWAWGIEDYKFYPVQFYISLSIDF